MNVDILELIEQWLMLQEVVNGLRQGGVGALRFERRAFRRGLELTAITGHAARIHGLHTLVRSPSAVLPN